MPENARKGKASGMASPKPPADLRLEGGTVITRSGAVIRSNAEIALDRITNNKVSRLIELGGRDLIAGISVGQPKS